MKHPTKRTAEHPFQERGRAVGSVRERGLGHPFHARTKELGYRSGRQSPGRAPAPLDGVDVG
jgi:hypothetical protein